MRLEKHVNSTPGPRWLPCSLFFSKGSSPTVRQSDSVCRLRRKMTWMATVNNWGGPFNPLKVIYIDIYIYVHAHVKLIIFITTYFTYSWEERTVQRL